MVASHSDPEIVELEGLLAVSEDYQEDLEFFRKRWTQGTCEWILDHPSFTEWIDESQGTMILWLNALPASGKSVLSSYIISHLLKENLCTFYFFRFGDQVKRSISTCLRTMIFQLADHLPRFRMELRAMRFPAKTLEKLDAKTLWEKVFVGVLFKMRLATTMYWVIDALDESDSSQALVELMQGLAKSTSPIKVLLVSRKTPELVQTFDRLQKVSVRVKDLPVKDTKKDIRTYVETEVQYMHAPDDFKARVIERLVDGAAGNFLWARLAAIEVMKCNTEEDLDEILEGIPSGMENLYQRMEQTIIKTNKPRDHRLGQMILTWAACSRRPLLLKELIQALQPEFPVVMDLSYIINRVCGHFVAVDATNRLVMVHQTARDHITTTKSVLGVKVADAHEKLFLKCITVLEEKCSRRHPDRRNGNSKTPDYQEFLRYAMTSWNYHLNLTSSESDDPLVLLAKFLKGHSVLAWIEYLASNNILKVLVYSSKAMTTYARRKRSRYAGTNPLQHHLQELDLVESWAVDLLKIIGKFGPNIVADPKAIYNQVPPFCPKNSATYRHFEQSAVQPRLLTVKGISNVEWDDSLAKLDLGSGTQALIVAASGDHIAAATSGGDVFLYNATTFELKRVLKHKELISTISFSHCTKKLVTYGSRTTKIWSVSTGSIVHEISNPKGSRAFTIVFANGDSELVAGSADRHIRVADLTMPCPAWVILHPSLLKDETVLDRPVHKSPWKMAFNSDASYIAVAYRNFPLCVWSLDPNRPELINRCMRDKQYAGNSWTVVDQIIWHSDSDELIGLYMGGQVFRWNPHTNEQQELQAEASILASSPDGKFFAVGDSNGSIKLYDFQHFALVYQLSFDSMICDICFSPDGKRLYDVRGQYCNVWEPNALIRAEVNGEQDSEDRSDVASIPTLAVSETFAEVRDQVTAVAIQFQGRYQAIANEAGVVMIIDTLADEYRAVQIWRASIPLSIANLAWSDDGNFLACSELTGRVVVKRVQRINPETWRVKPTFDVKVTINGDGIQQILLNDIGTLLLVKNGSATTVWSLDERTSSGTWKVSISSPDTKWTKHPTERRLLLAFDCTHVRIHQWADLTEVAAFTLTTDIPQPLTPITANSQILESRFLDLRIQSIHLNPSGTQCLLDFVQPTATGDQHSLTLFEVPRSGTRTLKSERISAEMQAQIEMPLGFLPNQRLVFLDKSYWMCTLRLDAGSSVESIQRHYFLPKDWLNARCLQHCAVLHDGKVLVPNNGDLAVIACLEMGG
jgi:WD40 repeat protein